MKGRTALITGATGGLGKELCKRLAAEQCNLILLGRSAEALASFKEELKSVYPTINVSHHALDFCSDTQLDAFLALDLEVDILINCAGIFPLNNIKTVTPDGFRRCFNVNVKAPLFLSQKFSMGMVRRQWGRIVNIGSSSAYGGSPSRGLYCASKHALLGLSRSLYLELKTSNVRVFTISPGSIQTPMGATDEGQDFSTFIQAAEVSDYIVYVMKFNQEMISEEIRLNRIIIK